MEINKYILTVILLLAIPASANEHVKECIGAAKSDILHKEIKLQSEPFYVNQVLLITASVKQEDIHETLKAYPNPPSTEGLEICFSINPGSGFKVLSGKEKDNCDQFDVSGKTQVTWALEAIEPGKNQRISFDLGWKSIHGQTGPICFSQPQECFVTVLCTSNWWLDYFLIKNWDKTWPILISLSSLLISIIALIKKALS